MPEFSTQAGVGKQCLLSLFAKPHANAMEREIVETRAFWNDISIVSIARSNNGLNMACRFGT
jgi:hypothetical protein